MVAGQQVRNEWPTLPQRRQRRAGIPDNVPFANTVPEIY
jgi:hypothetical protein